VSTCCSISVFENRISSCHLPLNASEAAYRKHLQEARRAIEDAAAAAKERG
jgi:hypothetical protein